MAVHSGKEHLMIALGVSFLWSVMEAAVLVATPLTMAGAILMMRKLSRLDDAELGRVARFDNSELSW